MKLKNKKTEEIGILIVDGAYKFVTNFAVEDDEMNRLGEYNSLAELNEEWEDAPEEPKEYWYIDFNGEVKEFELIGFEWQGWMKEIGNYFETKEEAEKAVEKLKAWKRLKDNGLVIKKWRHTPDMNLTTGSFLKIEGFIPAIMKNIKDLDLLFGGEE